MKPSRVLPETIVHPDVKELVIDGMEVCPNGKIFDAWKDDFRLDGDQHQVSSLEGCPRVVENWFRMINQNHLTSLNGSPEKADLIDIGNCPKLQDLTGITPDCGSYRFYDNERLLSLNRISTHQALDLYVNDNPKLSFTTCYFPSIKLLHWINNKDVSLHDFHRHFPKISRYLYISDQIQSHALSVLLVEGLQKIYSDDRLNPMAAIINKHLPNTTGKKGMLRCQAALIDAGYAEHAQL